MFLLGDINQILLQKIAEVFHSKQIMGVQGDFGFQGDLEYYGILDCHGKVVELNKYRIAGVEGSNRYKAGPYPMHTQDEIKTLCQQLPSADILLCHNTPCGYHDQADHPVYQGFVGLTDYIERCSPRFLFHGHHNINSIDHQNNTTLIGVFGGIIYDFESMELEYVLKLSKK
ncbi:Ser/Thr protein phosphatase (plasmid) [Brevibacillus halotolerans]|nr:Ser/Thr protein phosphatase [Brevibacillus halotolerans]